MVKSAKYAFTELADLLARQANMERWCHCLLSALREQLKLAYITLLVEQNQETRVLSSWVDDDFKYYSNSLTLDEYNGIPMGLYREAKISGQYVTASVDKPYKALWCKEASSWSQLLLPIRMHATNVGFIYAETIEPGYFENSFEHVENLLLLLASDLSARMLRREVIDHHLTRRSVEAELEIRNHSLSEYLSLLKNLHEVTLNLSKVPELEQLYKSAVDLGRKHLGIDRMAIFLTDFSKNEMRGTYGTDPDGNLVPRGHFKSPIPDYPPGP